MFVLLSNCSEENKYLVISLVGITGGLGNTYNSYTSTFCRRSVSV